MTITRELQFHHSGWETGRCCDTYVLVNDLTRGQGIFIENMLDAAR